MASLLPCLCERGWERGVGGIEGPGFSLFDVDDPKLCGLFVRASRNACFFWCFFVLVGGVKRVRKSRI